MNDPGSQKKRWLGESNQNEQMLSALRESIRIEKTRHPQLMANSEIDFDGLERVLQALANLDLPVHSSTLRRDPVSRLHDVARIAAKIEASLGQSGVPCISQEDLHRYRSEVGLEYRKMLDELYEAAALFDVTSTALDLYPPAHAIKFYQDYLLYARGYRDQTKRIGIAEHRLNLLQQKPR